MMRDAASLRRDGARPTLPLARAAAIHPRFGTPARAIAVQATLASVLVLLGTFQTIVAYFIFITVMFIGLTAASVFAGARRRPPGSRAAHMVGCPDPPQTKAEEAGCASTRSCAMVPEKRATLQWADY